MLTSFWLNHCKGVIYMEMTLWRNSNLENTANPLSEWVTERDFVPQERGDVSLYETDCDLVAKARVPGVSAENVTIWIDGGLLTIAACQSESEEERSSKKVVYREAKEPQYIYNVPLVRTVNTEDVVAEIENGVVTVTMPKE